MIPIDVIEVCNFVIKPFTVCSVKIYTSGTYTVFHVVDATYLNGSIITVFHV